MTIYVDEARQHDTQFTRTKGRRWWCHLASDLPGAAGTDELVAFAVRLGLSPRWIQHPGTRMEHFDLTADPAKGGQKRTQAIRQGATPITSLEFARRVTLAKAGIDVPEWAVTPPKEQAR